jgi:hypothetical protein
MRRLLVVFALVAAVFASSAEAGQLTDIDLVRDCGPRQLCFQVELKHGALTAASHNGKLELFVRVVYAQEGVKPLEQMVNVPLKGEPIVAASVVVPENVSTPFVFEVKAVLVLTRGGINRTGDRSFFVDETGVIRATDKAEPVCDDTDDDPTNDCPDALNN